MENNSLPLIFDGHNDLPTRILMKDASGGVQQFLDGYETGHLDISRIRNRRSTVDISPARLCLL